MKKATALLVTVMMVISLTACASGNSGSSQNSGNGLNSGFSNPNNFLGTQEESNSSTDDFSEDNGSDSEYVWGQVGETMKTYWFDFNVTSATLYSEYEGNTPTDGYQFLELKIWLKNTFNESVPMFWSDFDVEWDDPDSYELPVFITVDGKELTEEEYSLRRAGSLDLVLVYEVAEGYDDFFVFFDEDFADGTVGDVFAVYLAPEQE